MANATPSEQYCPNAYSERVLLTSDQALVFQIAFISLAPVTVITNGIVIYRIAKSKQYRNVSNFLIFVMSIADFLVGVVTLPCVYALYSTYSKLRFCMLELAAQFISASLVDVSIAMIMFIAIERLIHQKFKSSSGATFSNRTAHCCVLCTILAALTLCSIMAMSSTYNSLRVVNLVFSIIVTAIITVVFVSYVLTYLQISRFVRASMVRKGENQPTQRSAERRVPVYLRHLGKTAFLIILGVIFCYLPFVILMFVSMFTDSVEDCVKECNIFRHQLRLAFCASYVLIYSNSSLNALIILIRNRSIARYVQQNRNNNAVAPEKATRGCYAMSPR